MTCVKKQMILRGLPLPEDTINMIKDYTFTNIEEKCKKIKNQMVRILNEALYGVNPLRFQGTTTSEIDGTYGMFIDGEYFRSQTQFCTKCGDYTDVHLGSYEFKNIKLWCVCENSPALFWYGYSPMRQYYQIKTKQKKKITKKIKIIYYHENILFIFANSDQILDRNAN